MSQSRGLVSVYSSYDDEEPNELNYFQRYSIERVKCQLASICKRDHGLPFDFRGKYRQWVPEIVEMSRRMFRKQVLARYWNAPRVRSKSLFTGTLRSVYASCFPPMLLSFSERKATVWIGHDRFIIFLHFRRSSLIIRSSVLLLFVSLYGSFRWSLFPSLMLGNFT